MSRQEKLIKRLLARPKDFSWAELCTLLRGLGYTLENGSGSRRSFLYGNTGIALAIHEPHPSGILKSYQVRDVIENLKKNKLI